VSGLMIDGTAFNPNVWATSGGEWLFALDQVSACFFPSDSAGSSHRGVAAVVLLRA